MTFHATPVRTDATALARRAARRRPAPLRLLLAAGLVAGLSASTHAQVDVHWSDPLDGDWFDPAMWTGGVAPDNTPKTSYRVFLDATGQPYTVTLASAVTVNDLVLDSADATLLLNFGAVFTALNSIDLNAGTLNVEGGTIAGATINLNGGLLQFNNHLSNTLDSVTINGDFDLLGGTNIVNSFALNGTCRLASRYSLLNFNGALSVESGTFVFDTELGFDVAHIGVTSGSILTLGPGVVVRGGHGDIGHQEFSTGPNTVINEGLISADRAGGTLAIVSSSFTNTGTLEARNNGALSINADTWSNTGSIIVDNGTLNLGGTFTAADMGSISRTGGAVNLTGTLDNTDSTFTLNASTGSWGLNGGGIRGGTLNFADGAQLNIAAHVNNTLDGVTVNGDLYLNDTFSMLKVVNGIDLNGTVHIAGSDARFGFTDTTTLTGGTISFEGTEGNPRFLSGDFDQTLTLGPDVQVLASGGARGIVGYAVTSVDNVTVINQGTATATGAGSRIDFVPEHFINEGVINAVSGGTVSLDSSSPDGTWSNHGVINVAGGTLLLGGNTTPGGLGTINATSGALYITGHMDATNSTITTQAGVDFGLRRGGITNGTIVTDPTSPFHIEPDIISGDRYLRNVTINGNVAINTPNTTLTIDDALTLDGNFSVNAPGAILYCNNNQTINGGTFNFNAPSGLTEWRVSSDKTLTIGQDTILRGGLLEFSSQTYDTTLINNGHIIADRLGLTIGVGTRNAVNNGTIDVTGGNFVFGSAIGTINNGTINVSAGSLTIGNPFTQAPGGVINQTGGIVYLSGVLNNQGSTLDLNGPTAVWSLQNGSRVNGGTILLRNGAFLDVTRGVFQDVSLTGSFAVSGNGDDLSIIDSFNLAGEITLRQNATLQFRSVTDGIVEMHGGSIRLDLGAGSPRDAVNIGHNQTLVLSPTTTLHGGSAVVGRQLVPNVTTRLINEGTISADVTDQLLRLQPTYFENSGLVEAVNGGILHISYETTVVNTGILRAGPGSELLFEGKTTTANLGAYDGTQGQFRFAGLLDNTSDTFDLTLDSGVFRMAGGAIKGGTINIIDQGALLFGGGTLDETTVNGDLVTEDFGGIVIRNGITLNGDVRLAGHRSQLRFASTTTFDNANIFFDPTSGGDDRGVYTQQGQTTTLGPNASIQGGRGLIFSTNSSGSESAFINQGLIHSNIAGERILIYAARFLNQGTLQTSNGGQILFEPPGAAPEDQLTLTNTGTLDLGPETALQLNGSLIESAQATLRLAIGGSELAITPLSVFDLFSIDGALEVTLADDAPAPIYGEWFRLFYAGHHEGAFSNIDLPTLNGDLTWDTTRLYVDGSVQVIPGPTALLSILAGLSFSGLARRTRHTSRRHA